MWYFVLLISLLQNWKSIQSGKYYVNSIERKVRKTKYPLAVRLNGERRKKTASLQVKSCRKKKSEETPHFKP